MESESVTFFNSLDDEEKERWFRFTRALLPHQRPWNLTLEEKEEEPKGVTSSPSENEQVTSSSSSSNAEATTLDALIHHLIDEVKRTHGMNLRIWTRATFDEKCRYIVLASEEHLVARVDKDTSMILPPEGSSPIPRGFLNDPRVSRFFTAYGLISVAHLERDDPTYNRKFRQELKDQFRAATERSKKVSSARKRAARASLWNESDLRRQRLHSV